MGDADVPATSNVSLPNATASPAVFVALTTHSYVPGFSASVNVSAVPVVVWFSTSSVVPASITQTR